MTRKKVIENIVEWSTNLYLEIFSPYAGYNNRAIITDISETSESFRQKEIGRRVVKQVRKNPNRAKNFKQGGLSIMYIPNGESLEPIFEETWHSLSPLNQGQRNEETFVVLPRYIGLREAIREGKADSGRPKEIIENSITGEYSGGEIEIKTVDEEKYQYRNTCIGLLEYFEKGNNGDPVKMEKVAEISNQILGEIVDGESADRVIAKWERKIKSS